MKITSKAKERVLSILSNDPSLVPGIVWMCDKDTEDPMREGSWSLGFFEKKKVNDSLLITIDDIQFAIDVPEVLKADLDSSYLDYIDSTFLVRKDN